MDIWNYHNTKMLELKKIYSKVSKQTQNKLQEIFDTFSFTSDNLYNIADTKTKDRINTYIEEWKDKGLLTGYFGTLAKNIYNRTRVKNSEILELLIYGAYIEEQSKLKEQELNIMYDDVNYYYQEGQREVNNTLPKKQRKPLNILKWAFFLALLDQPNAKGYVYEQYIEATIKYNADQIYRQMTIDFQQQRQPDITNDIYQNLIRRQGNSKLNIKDGKATSGNIDFTLIGLNNNAKIEGIKYVDKNAECLFISDLCEHVTLMCSNMHLYKFKVDDWNSFDRWYGETAKDLKIERIKVKGLVLGINLPPITHHFHWCHSTIMYLKPESRESINFNEKFIIFRNNLKNIDKLQIKHIDKTALNNILNNMKKVYKDFPQIEGKIKEINEIRHSYGGINITPQEDGSYIMEINRNIFNDRKRVKDLYSKDVKTKFHPKNSTYKDMGIHEAGHMVLNEILRKKYNNINALATDWNNNITSTRIINKAFAKCKINGRINQTKAIKNISNYAYRAKGQEIIAEAFVDYYANKGKATNLSKAIISIMKGMI